MDTAIRAVLAQGWGLTLERAEKMGAGAGSDAWAVTTSKGKFLLKRPEINAMNNPEAEPALCAFLADRGVPVPRFLPLADGGTVLQAQGAA